MGTVSIWDEIDMDMETDMEIDSGGYQTTLRISGIAHLKWQILYYVDFTTI